MTALAAIAISISLEIVARLVSEDPNKYDIWTVGKSFRDLLMASLSVFFLAFSRKYSC